MEAPSYGSVRRGRGRRRIGRFHCRHRRGPNGRPTLLIEQLPFLGGNSTAVLDTFYGFFTPGERPRKVVGGIGDDVVAGLRRLGAVVERPNSYGAGTGITYLAEHLKVVWEHLVLETGASVLLHAMLVDVSVARWPGRPSSSSVPAQGCAGSELGVVVDASGDAAVCHHAGFGYELAGSVDPAQTLTTTFRMVNVDHEARAPIDTAQLHALMAEAADSGDVRPSSSGRIRSRHPGRRGVATVMTRLDQVRTDASGEGAQRHRSGRSSPPPRSRDDVRRWSTSGSSSTGCPGYGTLRWFALSTQIGLRETSRVFGDYRLTRADVAGCSPIRRPDRALRSADRGPPRRRGPAGRHGNTSPRRRRSGSRCGP